MVFCNFQPKAEPKEVIRMDDISVTLVPEKVGNPNAMQISFTQNGQYRSIYVFTEDSQVTIHAFEYRPLQLIEVFKDVLSHWASG